MDNLEITYNPNTHIIHVIKQGNISLAEAKSVLFQLVEQFDEHETIYILEDSRNSRLDISLREMNDFFRAIKDSVTGRKEIRHADIIDTPFETAMGVIFQQMVSPLKGYSYRCFSTQEAAIKWLQQGEYYTLK